uniref:Interleukin-12 subunit alpha n=1 Tax=Sciurus vulgaris TaxID=55149 RepID=A0A8D2JLD5_SCIVU
MRGELSVHLLQRGSSQVCSAVSALDHAGAAPSAPEPPRPPCLTGAGVFSVTPLSFSFSSQARKTLEFYSCSAEEVDHEDITKDRSSTVQACLPRELAQVQRLPPGAGQPPAASRTLCLSSIYEDLKMYQVELKTINAKLLMDPKRQISLDEDLLAAVDGLMQALNVNHETVPQRPSFEAPDFYRTKTKLCVLLHALRIRAVTIDRVMSYLNSS